MTPGPIAAILVSCRRRTRSIASGCETVYAYAAPLILLAQTRQADRDKALAIAEAEHREAIARESLERQEVVALEVAKLYMLLESIHDRLRDKEQA